MRGRDESGGAEGWQGFVRSGLRTDYEDGECPSGDSEPPKGCTADPNRGAGGKIAAPQDLKIAQELQTAAPGVQMTGQSAQIDTERVQRVKKKLQIQAQSVQAGAQKARIRTPIVLTEKQGFRTGAPGFTAAPKTPAHQA